MAKGNKSTPAPAAPETAVEQPAATPPFAPAEETPPPAPSIPAPDAPSEPRIEVGLESVAIIVAEPAPGVRRYIKGLSGDGRVLASDTRDESCYLNPRLAKSILARVRQAFPNAEIQLVLA